MGLDMYAYKIRKPTDDEAVAFEGMDAGELSGEFAAIRVSDTKDNDGELACKDLLHYASIIRMKTRCFNQEKFLEDHDIPRDAVCGMRSYSGESFTYEYFWKPAGSDKKISKELTFTDIDEFDRKYGYWEEEDYIVFCEDEVGYWRKNYDLQDRLYDAYEGQIVNCGYHLCNDEMLSLMREAGMTEDCECQDGEAIFYHEWY